MIKNCRISWETERHSFTFETHGCYITALDGLSDIIGSLNELYEFILTEYKTLDGVPVKIKVVGSGTPGIEVTEIWD